MEPIDKKKFLHLANFTGTNCITIYIPTHKGGKEVLEKQDVLLFKNHIKKINIQLKEKGLKSHEIAALLDPANGLLNDIEFWRNQLGGLAIFISEGFFEYYQTSIRFEEFSLLSQSFFLVPLLPLIEDPQKYYLLKLSKHNTVLFEASKYSIRSIESKNMPHSLKEVTRFYETDVDGMRDVEQGDHEIKFGGMAENKEKDHLLFDFFKSVNDAIMKSIGTNNCPLVIAGVEYFHPIYRKANAYQYIYPEGLKGSFDGATVSDLYQKSQELLHDYFEEPHKKKAEQFLNLTGSQRISTDIKEVLEGAFMGRVDTLFISKQAPIWGTFNIDELKTDVHIEFEENDECLLNKASVQALQTGAEIYVSSDNNVPEINEAAPVAAIFRY